MTCRPRGPGEENKFKTWLGRICFLIVLILSLFRNPVMILSVQERCNWSMLAWESLGVTGGHEIMLAWKSLGGHEIMLASECWQLVGSRNHVGMGVTGGHWGSRNHVGMQVTNGSLGAKARSCWHGSHWGSLGVTKSCWPRTRCRRNQEPQKFLFGRLEIHIAWATM